VRCALRRMGNIFSHADANDASSQSSTSLKRQSSNNAAADGLRQTIAQNMRLSKNKMTSLLKANHMNYSIVHRNHFYNTLPHVSSPTPESYTDDSTLVRHIFLELHRNGCLIFLIGSARVLSLGKIHLMRLLELTGIDGWAINGIR
jgi:hypothetical protein